MASSRDSVVQTAGGRSITRPHLELIAHATRKDPTGRPLEGGPSPSGEGRAARHPPGGQESTPLGLRPPAALPSSISAINALKVVILLSSG